MVTAQATSCTTSSAWCTCGAQERHGQQRVADGCGVRGHHLGGLDVQRARYLLVPARRHRLRRIRAGRLHMASLRLSTFYAGCPWQRKPSHILLISPLVGAAPVAYLQTLYGVA